MLLACTVVWLLAVDRIRTALSVDFFVVQASAAIPARRASLMHDVASIGRQGLFRPLSIASPGTPDSALSQPPPRLDPPSVQLKGVMGGPPWRAVLSVSGIAGEDRVLGAGDSLGAVHVRAVSAVGVTLSFMDSTWKIPLREERKP